LPIICSFACRESGSRWEAAAAGFVVVIAFSPGNANSGRRLAQNFRSRDHQSQGGAHAASDERWQEAVG